MLLAKVPMNGIASTRYLERYVNDLRPGNHHDWSQTDLIYSPHSGLPILSVLVLKIPREQVTIHTANPHPRLVEMVTPREVFFSIHPEMAADASYQSKFIDPNWPSIHIEATPTSSTRTLLTNALDYNFFIKTDLDRHHYGFIRSLKRTGVEHSIRMSEEVVNIATEHPDYGLAVLPETIGIAFGGHQDEYSTGVIYRECDPRPYAEDGRTLVPFFSLYATDLKAPDDNPLLVQLINKHATVGQELDYFLGEFVVRLLRPWCRFVQDHGILLEMHGQNTLLEIDNELQPKRVVVRDFQGMYLDADIRREIGLPVFSTLCLVGNEDGVTRRQHYSHLFDHLIGTLLLHRLTKTFTRHFPAHSYNDVAAEISRLVDGLIETSVWMPPEAYRFDKQRRQGKLVWIEKSREKPTFRT
jgi:hypothetical protein